MLAAAEVHARLKAAGIAPSDQRVAIAAFVLDTCAHPSADQVFAAVAPTQPSLSRATVFNTLTLLADKGLVQRLVIAEGRVVFDPKLEPHHHFVDDVTGAIEDVAFDAVAVAQTRPLPGLAVHTLQVVLRGTRAKA